MAFWDKRPKVTQEQIARMVVEGGKAIIRFLKSLALTGIECING